MRRITMAGCVLAAGLLSACQTSPVRPIPPAPQLLASNALQLPDNCPANGSFVMRFDVRQNGQTANIQPPPAIECVRTALTAWVASFRYAPLPGETPMSIEWLMVTAKQGG